MGDLNPSLEKEEAMGGYARRSARNNEPIGSNGILERQCASTEYEKVKRGMNNIKSTG